MFIVFYTVKIVYICVFMTCSTSHCVCDTKVHEVYLFVTEGKFLIRCIALQWCNTRFCRVAVYGCSATQYGFE